MNDFDPRQFYRDYIDALNERRLYDMDRFIHDAVTRNGKPSSRTEAVADIAQHLDAVPDFRWRIVDLVAEGNTIAVRLVDTGTPKKRWLDIEPTGVSVEYMELAMYKVRDGLFSEMNWAMDVAEVQRQMSSNRT